MPQFNLGTHVTHTPQPLLHNQALLMQEKKGNTANAGVASDQMCWPPLEAVSGYGEADRAPKRGPGRPKKVTSDPLFDRIGTDVLGASLD